MIKISWFRMLDRPSNRTPENRALVYARGRVQVDALIAKGHTCLKSVVDAADAAELEAVKWAMAQKGAAPKQQFWDPKRDPIPPRE